MSSAGHLPELDQLRSQVAGLARELAERDRALHEQTRHLHVAQALAHLGSWDWEIPSGRVDWSDEMYRLFGYEPKSLIITFDVFLSVILPNDHDRVLASINDTLAGKAPYDLECRIVRSNGEVRTIHCRGEVLRDTNGLPIRMLGTALDITDRKRKESALQQREAHYRTLIEHSSDAITILELDGTIRFESPSFERLLGYAQHELNGRIAFELLHPEDLPGVLKKFQLLIQKPDTPQIAEFRFHHKDGSWLRFEGIGRSIVDPDGRRCVIVNSRDITERKRAEVMLRSSQEKLRQALQASGTGLWDWNTETNEVVFSREWKRQLGYGETELPDSFETWKMLLHPDDHDGALAYTQAYLTKPDGDYRQEFRLKHKEGTYRWIEARASFVTEADGRQIRLLGSHTDVTDRKRMEQVSRESEEHYRALVELLPSGVFVFCDERTVYINQMGAILLGAKDPREILDRPTFDFIHPDYHDEVRENVKRLLSGGVSVHRAERIYLKLDGTAIPVQVEAARITWSGKPAILGIFSDITERKQVEDRVREINLALAQATPGISRIGTDGLYREVNQHYAVMLGYEPSELLGCAWEPSVHPDDLPIARAAYELLRSVGKAEFECRAVRKDGSVFFQQVLMVRDKPSVNGAFGHHCFMRDITERKQAEEALRESEERFATAFRTSPHPIGITELETGRCIEVNDACLQLFGLCREEVIGNTTVLLGMWPNPEDRARFLERLNAGAPIHNLEMSVKTKLGEVRHLLVSSDVVELNGTLCLITVGNDITERKRAVEALQRSERDLRTVLDALPIGVWFTDRNGKPILSNPASQRIWAGARAVEWVAGEQIWRETTEQTTGPHRWALSRVLVHGESSLKEIFEFDCGEEGKKTILNSAVPVRDDDGTVVGAVVLNEDISDRVQAEEALRISEERFAKAFQASPHPVVISELDSGRLVDANEAAYQLFGYCKEEVAGKTMVEIGLWYDLDERARYLDLLKHQGSVRNMEVQLRSKSGEARQCLVSSELIVLNGRQCVVAVGDDITERKRAEAELRKSHTFLRQVIDTNPDFIFAKDREGRFTLVNEAVAECYGSTVEELIGKTDADFNANAEEVEFFRQKDLEVMESLQERFIPEELITDSRGQIRWLQTVKRPILDDQGQAMMVLGAATDITERKRMEEILLQRERDLSAALQERERISQDLHDGILQALYAVGLGLEGCKPLIAQQHGKDGKKLLTALNQEIGQLNHVMAEVRNFIAGLESHVMQGSDFSTALRSMIQTMSSASSAKCRVRIDETAARHISTDQALHIINIVREGLSNALRHSHATHITVSFVQLRRSVRLSITDDGVGFAQDSTHGLGHGLDNMAARAQKVRGLLTLRAEPGGGTRILLDLPKDTTYDPN